MRLGTPSPRNATKAEKLGWTRRVYLRIFTIGAVVYALVAIVGAPRWVWAVLIVGAGAWLFGFAQVNVEIRRERRRTPGATG
jgi:predicted lysophospholipase L1 biosynthesis ABC-type transport system permease subunit